MTHVDPKDIEPGRVYMITATTGVSQGLVGRLMRILASDGDYCVMEIPDPLRCRYTVRRDEFSYALPSDEFLDAALDGITWDDVIGV